MFIPGKQFACSEIHLYGKSKLQWVIHLIVSVWQRKIVLGVILVFRGRKYTQQFYWLGLKMNAEATKWKRNQTKQPIFKEVRYYYTRKKGQILRKLVCLAIVTDGDKPTKFSIELLLQWTFDIQALFRIIRSNIPLYYPCRQCNKQNRSKLTFPRRHRNSPLFLFH